MRAPAEACASARGGLCARGEFREMAQCAAPRKFRNIVHYSNGGRGVDRGNKV